ncbi:MAG: Rare lipoprotein A precursor [uncultured Sulfurovum sp.]|uniref:Probable endolytic peptidoglycan transglycosylase RlpA n=1 Tax=uncultured Sulfurovum sp. TaxID=269237 RepID=A0A6S6T4S9_9BACT|nr:MAG: Rare lipoprotein A precursor [uncultured Sulfurovum sp.]
MNTLFKTILLPALLLLTFTTSAFSKDNNIRTYKDRGIKYYPFYPKKGTIKYGKASWYGKPFHGRLTANGERYNMHGMTAAHRTYALGTVLKVTSLQNWRSVIVRVNDRGPFYSSRHIDLSYGVAKKLGFVNKGIEKIKIEVLSSKGKYSSKKYASSKAGSGKSAKAKSIVRDHKIQVASFFDKENANSFKKKHKLKNAVIVKQYVKDHKKTAYKIIVKCTPWEADKLLKSKKFSGAYKV